MDQAVNSLADYLDSIGLAKASDGVRKHLGSVDWDELAQKTGWVLLLRAPSHAAHGRAHTRVTLPTPAVPTARAAGVGSV